MQRNRKWLCQRRNSERQAVRHPAQRSGIDRHELREAAIERVVTTNGGSLAALCRLASSARITGTARRFGTTDDPITERPARNVVADVDNHAGVFVSADATRLAPTVHHHVEISATHPAVADFHDNATRKVRRGRALFDRHAADTGDDSDGVLEREQSFAFASHVSARKKLALASIASGGPEKTTCPRSNDTTSWASANA